MYALITKIDRNQFCFKVNHPIKNLLMKKNTYVFVPTFFMPSHRHRPWFPPGTMFFEPE